MRLAQVMPSPSSAARPRSIEPLASGSGGISVKMAVIMGRLPTNSGVYGYPNAIMAWKIHPTMNTTNPALIAPPDVPMNGARKNASPIIAHWNIRNSTKTTENEFLRKSANPNMAPNPTNSNEKMTEMMSSMKIHEHQKAESSIPLVLRACRSPFSFSDTMEDIRSTKLNMLAAKMNGPMACPTMLTDCVVGCANIEYDTFHETSPARPDWRH